MSNILPDTNVPAEIMLGFQSEIVSENFVLTAWRTESGRHTGVERRVCPVDPVAACNAISPDPAELIEMIEPATSNEDQVFDWRQCRLQKSGDLFGVIAHKGRLRAITPKRSPDFNATIKET